MRTNLIPAYPATSTRRKLSTTVNWGGGQDSPAPRDSSSTATCSAVTCRRIHLKRLSRPSLLIPRVSERDRLLPCGSQRWHQSEVSQKRKGAMAFKPSPLLLRCPYGVVGQAPNGQIKQ